MINLLLSIPMTVLLLSILIIGVLLIYYFSSLGHEYSPTGKIYVILKKKKRTFEEIIGDFPPDLITDRLENLKKIGLIRHKEKKFYLTWTGKAIVLFFVLYRRILGWG